MNAFSPEPMRMNWHEPEVVHLLNEALVDSVAYRRQRGDEYRRKLRAFIDRSPDAYQDHRKNTELQGACFVPKFLCGTAPSSIAAKGFLPEGIDANRTTFAGMEMSLVGGVGKEGGVMIGEGADNRSRGIGIVTDGCWGGSAVREVSLFQEPGQEPATTWVIDRVRQCDAAQGPRGEAEKPMNPLNLNPPMRDVLRL